MGLHDGAQFGEDLRQTDHRHVGGGDQDLDAGRFHGSTADAPNLDRGVEVLQGPNKVGAMQVRRGFTRNDQDALAGAGISKWF
jgi:hypothetical protein